MKGAQRRLRDVLKRRGPQLLPSSRAMVREALCLLTPWDVGVPLIRLGGDGDGGYLVPDDLEGLQALLSPGVAEKWHFERVIGDRFGIPSYMIDGSVNAPDGLSDLQHFERVWLGSRSGDGVVSLEEWVASVAPETGGDLMMQMDIEGAEYEVLASAPLHALRRFRTIIIEFHGLDWLRFAPALSFRLLPAWRRMSVDFEVVHVHPNNCCGTFTTFGVPVPRVLEVTYLRRDRVRGDCRPAELPHKLDRDCVEGVPPIRLSKSWPRAR